VREGGCEEGRDVRRRREGEGREGGRRGKGNGGKKIKRERRLSI